MMKKRLFALALTALLLFALPVGCAPTTKDDSAAVTNETIIPDTATPMASSYPSPDPDMISQQQAMDIALAHAEVQANAVDFMQVEFDIDDGRAEYEVQFCVGQTEYEYEIAAKTGDILSFDKDLD